MDDCPVMLGASKWTWELSIGPGDRPRGGASCCSVYAMTARGVSSPDDHTRTRGCLCGRRLVWPVFRMVWVTEAWNVSGRPYECMRHQGRRSLRPGGAFPPRTRPGPGPACRKRGPLAWDGPFTCKTRFPNFPCECTPPTANTAARTPSLAPPSQILPASSRLAVPSFPSPVVLLSRREVYLHSSLTERCPLLSDASIVSPCLMTTIRHRPPFLTKRMT